MQSIQQQALEDENLLPNQVPDGGDVCNQLKRRKMAEALLANGEATDQDVGNRQIGVVDLALKNLIGNINPNQAGLAALISNSVNLAIDRACQPNGPATLAIDRACHPSGSITLALERAMGKCFNALVSLQDSRSYNSNAIANIHLITALPNSSSQRPLFPNNVADFWNMNNVQVTDLLRFYDLSLGGTLRARLASYCYIKKALIDYNKTRFFESS